MTLPTRKNPRLKDYDYANAGAYFVTICTHHKQAIFGQNKSGVVELSPYGEHVERAWREIPEHFPAVYLDEFVVMPNHVHGVVFIESERARHASPLQPGPKLGTVIGAFKSAAAGAEWSKSFYQILTEQPGKDSWPITGATFILMQKVQDKPAQAAVALKFFDWAYKNGDKTADDLDYVPMPANVKTIIEKAWGDIKDTSGKTIAYK